MTAKHKKQILRAPGGTAAPAAGADKPFGQFVEVERTPDPAWPDWMDQLGEPKITQEAFRARMMVNSKAFHEGKIKVRGTIAVVGRLVNGRLVESVQDGKRYSLQVGTKESDRPKDKGRSGWTVEMVRIPDNEAFKKLVESNEWRTAKILEAWDSFDYGGDWAGGGQVGPPNDEFIPLLGGPFSKQLYLTDFLEMQAKCFWVKNHHPLGSAVIRTLRNYAIGKGVDVLFKAPECQHIWDAFVERTGYNAYLRDNVTTKIWGGETMDFKTRNEGGALLQDIDPSTVWEVVTDPANIKNVLYYHQQYPTQWQMTYKNDDPGSEYVINDIPADQVLHLKENCTPGEKRGRSLLFPVLSWLKMYRDYVKAKVAKAQIEESYAMDIEVDGSQQDVTTWAQANSRVPRPGTAFVHNKQVQRKYLQPTSSSTGGKDDAGELLRKDIAVGTGIAPEWIGETGAGASRANSLVKEAPATRTIEDLQTGIEEMVQAHVKYVLQVDGKDLPAATTRKADLGSIKKALSKRDWGGVFNETKAALTNTQIQEPLDRGCEVIFPEISKEDRTGKIADILKGEVADYISHERAATMYAKEMAINNYDYDDEQQAIQADDDNALGPEWRTGATAAMGGGKGQGDAAAGGGKPEPGSQAGGADLRQGQGK